MAPRASRRDCILASATPVGAAERAVLRLSGPDLLSRATEFLPSFCPHPRGLREVREGKLEFAPGCMSPVALFVFPGPHSATGEDVLELHYPGSPALTEMLLEHFFTQGVRLAEPGEFTRRAFLNGRLDLTQAEAVLGLVGSRNAQEAEAAKSVLSGRLATGLTSAREALSDALVQVEAALDFEEGDSQDIQTIEIDALLDSAAASLSQSKRVESQRRLRHDGAWRIGLIGAPKAGKSTLFSKLTGAPILISSEAGTTRDRIEASWPPFSGSPAESTSPFNEPWVLCDFPGLGGDAVDERDAAARARATHDFDEIDAWWCVVDASDPEAQLVHPPTDAPHLVYCAKSDLPRSIPESAFSQLVPQTQVVWHAPDLALATRCILDSASRSRAALLAVGERYQQAFADSIDALKQAKQLHLQEGPQELIAEELRAALAAIGALVGELTPEDLLDRLFAGFCLGK